jgi:hypothetical protein
MRWVSRPSISIGCSAAAHEGLMELRTRTLTVLDPNGLGKVAGFDPDYLHVSRREKHPS